MIDFDSYKSPYCLFDLMEKIDNADDFNEILNRQTYQFGIHQKNSIYRDLCKNKNIDKFFDEIYTNDVFKFEIQKNFIITNDNHYLISTKWWLCKLFYINNKIKYLVDNLDVNNYIILVYFLIREKSKQSHSIIKKFKNKYNLFNGLYTV